MEGNKTLSGPTFLVVTGASRGFGRAAVLSLSKTCDPVTIVLVARSLDGLQETKKLLEADGIPEKAIRLIQTDLTNVSNIPMKEIFKMEADSVCQRAILVNNAGSLGDLSLTVKDMTNTDIIRTYTDFNLLSCMALTTQFLRMVEIHKTVINISSLLAVQAFAGWGMYAPIKAARDMFHQVVSKENPEVRVLNYAPGPLDTEMQREVRETLCIPADKELFSKMHQDGKLVDPKESADKLADQIAQNKFESGAHVDFYDI
eukprot:m.161542 g.161542  ORF g.161542 m.161542 type:complete len:259 (-) comp15188_c0_seq12:3229-4005(-)